MIYSPKINLTSEEYWQHVDPRKNLSSVLSSSLPEVEIVVKMEYDWSQITFTGENIYDTVF